MRLLRLEQGRRRMRRSSGIARCVLHLGVFCRAIAGELHLHFGNWSLVLGVLLRKFAECHFTWWVYSSRLCDFKLSVLHE